MAGILAAAEITGELHELEVAAEGWLLFRAWEEDGDEITAGQAAYERAVADGRVPEWAPSVTLYLDTAAATIAELSGMSLANAEWVVQQYNSSTGRTGWHEKRGALAAKDRSSTRAIAGS